MFSFLIFTSIISDINGFLLDFFFFDQVETDGYVARILNAVKAANKGIVEAIPLNQKVARASPEYPKEEGMQPMEDVIDCDEKFWPALADLCFNKLITKDFETAIKLSKKYPGKYSYITMDGEIFNENDT